MPSTARFDGVREFCLSLPGATEKLQWEDDLCFKVAGKIFAVLGLDSVPQRLCFKCTPEKFSELVEVEGIIPAPYVGRYKWVLVERPGVLSAREIENLVQESYALISAKIPAKRRKPKAKCR